MPSCPLFLLALAAFFSAAAILRAVNVTAMSLPMPPLHFFSFPSLLLSPLLNNKLPVSPQMLPFLMPTCRKISSSSNFSRTRCERHTFFLQRQSPDEFSQSLFLPPFLPGGCFELSRLRVHGQGEQTLGGSHITLKLILPRAMPAIGERTRQIHTFQASSPQGAPVSPVLFISSVSVLFQWLQDRQVTLRAISFVDDVGFAIECDDFEEGTTHQEGIAKDALQWGSDNEVEFEVSKTGGLLFSRQRIFGP